MYVLIDINCAVLKLLSVVKIYLRKQCGILFLFLSIALFLLDILNSFIYSLDLIIFFHLQNVWTSSFYLKSRLSLVSLTGNLSLLFTKHLTSAPTPPLHSKYIFAYLTLQEVYGKSKQRFQS